MAKRTITKRNTALRALRGFWNANGQRILAGELVPEGLLSKEIIEHWLAKGVLRLEEAEDGSGQNESQAL